ncbi:MAG: leucine-rich repeat domain-containing protein [Oscillospiraceae bacterium]|jgi:predicted Ser/Thr protein kinase|nr:leucine-rich repeat domain-containing protein [Oscillospiraceae bacterium]
MSICYNCFTEHGGGVCPHCGYENDVGGTKHPFALPEGTVLAGRYLIGRVLGQGGFGITYLALDRNTNEKVAIKEYFPDTLSIRVSGEPTVSLYSEDKRENFAYGAEKFTEEARTLSTLSTVRGITQILGYFEENNTSYFAMEYIEGVSFKQYIANNGGRVSVEDAIRILSPVMNALTAVHRLGLIHRDVTPDNIYITKDGEVKLLDFGSAQYSLGEKSQTLDAILKPGYAPKEQYMRRSRQGPFTDVYSLGACFYASITGLLPPESLERNEIDEILTISEQGVTIDQNAENAIMTALAVNAPDRFQSMESFKAAITGEAAVTAPVRTAAQVSAPRYSVLQPAAQTSAQVTAPEQEKPARSVRKPNKKLLAALGGGIAVIAVALLLVFTLPKADKGVPAITQGGSSESGATSNNRPPASGKTVTITGREYDTGSTISIYYDNNTVFTDQDLENIGKLTELTQLYINGRDIADVSFLSGCTKLQTLSIYNSNGNSTVSLSDITPLKNMTEMRELRLSGTMVTDIAAVANMTQLEWLEFPALVTDWEPLRGLTKLKQLQVYNYNNSGNTQIPIDIDVLTAMTELTRLNLQSNVANDLTPLAGMTKLTELYISTATGDISALSAMTELKTLTLSRVYNNGPGILLTDLSPLKDLRKLENLNIYIQIAAELTPLAGLTNLKNLYIYSDDNMPIRDLSPLKNLTKLETLQIDGQLDAELTPLAGLANLRSLYLNVRLQRESGGYENNYDSGEFDISGIAGLSKLTSLSMYVYGSDGWVSVVLEPLRGLTELTSLNISAAVTNVEPLSGLTKLQTISLQGSGYTSYAPGLTEISSLGKLPNLLSLEVPFANLTDIGGIEGFPNLVSLNLSYNSIKDISALSSLPKLQSVDLTDNPVTDWSPVDHVPSVAGKPSQ